MSGRWPVSATGVAMPDDASDTTRRIAEVRSARCGLSVAGMEPMTLEFGGRVFGRIEAAPVPPEHWGGRRPPARKVVEHERHRCSDRATGVTPQV